MIKWQLVRISEDNDQKVMQALEELGLEYRYAWIGDVYERGDNLWDPSDQVVIHGPVLPTRHLTEKNQWVSWLDSEKTDCTDYYPVFGDLLMQSDYTMLPLGELRRKWDWLVEQFGNKYGQVFIRPNQNNKLFTGRLIPGERFTIEEELGFFEIPELPRASLVVVARPQYLRAEYRLFMHRTQFLTGSSYKIGYQAIYSDIVPQSIIELAREVAQRIYPGVPPVWCCDVAETGYGPKLLEISGSTCAGFYGADHKIILRALTEEAELVYKNRQAVIMGA